VARRGGQTEYLTGPDGVPNGAERDARQGLDGVPDGWPDGMARRGGQTGCPTGPDGCHVIGHVIFECHVISHFIFECHFHPSRVAWVILLSTLVNQR
jgi:hypothetical protein